MGHYRPILGAVYKKLDFSAAGDVGLAGVY
jgi:hypothetical protein